MTMAPESVFSDPDGIFFLPPTERLFLDLSYPRGKVLLSALTGPIFWRTRGAAASSILAGCWRQRFFSALVLNFFCHLMSGFLLTPQVLLSGKILLFPPLHLETYCVRGGRIGDR